MGWRISKRGGSLWLHSSPETMEGRKIRRNHPKSMKFFSQCVGWDARSAGWGALATATVSTHLPAFLMGLHWALWGAWDLPKVNCSILFVVIMVNPLLCLTYNLNFITGMYRWKKHSTRRVQPYLWFQASTGVLGTYFLWTRGNYCIFHSLVSPSFLLFSFNYLFHLPILSLSMSICCYTSFFLNSVQSYFLTLELPLAYFYNFLFSPEFSIWSMDFYKSLCLINPIFRTSNIYFSIICYLPQFLLHCFVSLPVRYERVYEKLYSNMKSRITLSLSKKVYICSWQTCGVTGSYKPC